MTLVVTIAMINPYVFLEHALARGFLDGDSDALTEWYVENIGEHTETPASLLLVPQRAKKYLEQYCTADFERFLAWED